MMPVSEDELDSRIHSSLSQNGEYRYSALSKAEQRKNNKPIMEKRRRARINQCLNELKALILDATNKDPARHTKLEKADILEMTVKHLQNIQRQHLSTAVAADPTVIHKFKTGFNECASEVSRYISSLDGIDNGVRKRLVEHLSSCISSTSQPLSLPAISNAFVNTPPELRTGHVDDLDNNLNLNNSNDVAAARFQGIPGLQLIPSRLPSGELALLLPNASSLSSLFPGGTLDLAAGSRSRVSAFTPVSKDAIKSECSAEDVPASVAYDSSHSEVSSTSNDGISFKTPHTPTKPYTTSTSSSLLIPVTELHSPYKKDQHSYTLSGSDRNVFKPLTVYTDPCYELSPSRSSPPLARKSPIDFSIKKEGDNTSSSTSRQARKRPLEDLPCNVQLPTKSMRLLMEPATKNHDCDSSRNLNSVTSDSATSGDMWRPW